MRHAILKTDKVIVIGCFHGAVEASTLEVKRRALSAVCCVLLCYIRYRKLPTTNVTVYQQIIPLRSNFSFI